MDKQWPYIERQDNPYTQEAKHTFRFRDLSKFKMPLHRKQLQLNLIFTEPKFNSNNFVFNYNKGYWLCNIMECCLLQFEWNGIRKSSIVTPSCKLYCTYTCNFNTRTGQHGLWTYTSVRAAKFFYVDY